MTSTDRGNDPSILDHDLAKHFPELLKFESTPEMEASDLYARIQPEVERIMNAVVVESFHSMPNRTLKDSDESLGELRDESRTLNALAWNIERGNVFEGIVDALTNHDQLKDKDVMLLTELDYGMARSGNRFAISCATKRFPLRAIP